MCAYSTLLESTLHTHQIFPIICLHDLLQRVLLGAQENRKAAIDCVRCCNCCTIACGHAAACTNLFPREGEVGDANYVDRASYDDSSPAKRVCIYSSTDGLTAVICLYLLSIPENGSPIVQSTPQGEGVL